mmetsp:Transcript_40378/g.79346  ORF Transcript_40378/g.79346 Transcript_40378/m.79346 type:complete len:172 (+) Transcript_40378:2-517(+)
MVSGEAAAAAGGGERLGCYFCNDVVAPADSLTDRTLDQQCTVTRPGLAYMAAALSVELATAALHHPLKHAAPAELPNQGSGPSSRFGIIPHQLRGFLASYNITPVTGQAFDRCSACCDKVISAFNARGVEFVVEVLQNPKVLEDLSGLTELKAEADAMAEDWDVDESDDDF